MGKGYHSRLSILNIRGDNVLIYVSGPYSTGDIDENIQASRQVAIKLWEMGHAVICPHTNTAHFEQDCTATYEQYIWGDLLIVSRCDAMVMTCGWGESPGANKERDYAIQLNIPVYEFPDLPTLHPTEVRCPIQSRSFLETVMQMYRVHLNKNADYSPANIMAPGELGLITRLWDKVARLMNLYGFRFEVSSPGVFVHPINPSNESIDDSFMDAAVYSVIGILLRRGAWGR